MILARLGSSGELILISSGLLWHLACPKIERRKTHNARPSACVGASLCTLPCCSSQPPPPPRLPLGRPWITLRVSLDHPSALPLWAADGIGRCWWEHSLGEPGTDLGIWTSWKHQSVWNKAVPPFYCFVEDMTRAMYALRRYLRGSEYDCVNRYLYSIWW